MFRERGVEVGVGEIADRAGVGRGTLFRNFPTKQELVVAVIAHRMHEAIATGRALLDANTDEELLFPFMTEVIGQQQQVDRGLFDVVAKDEFLNHPEMRSAHAQIAEVIDEMIAHDQRLGLVRDGIGAIDVLMLVKGACVVCSSLAELGPDALDRHLSLVWAAIAAPGRDLPLQGHIPILADLQRKIAEPGAH
jgi:AcrR family transcriptional regulator